MRMLLVAVTSASLALLAHAPHSQSPRGVATDVSTDTIEAYLSRVRDRPVSDQAIRMVDLGKYNVGIGVVHRHMPGTQGAIEHSEITEVYHVLKGAGTFVTGGTIPNGTASAPDGQVVQVLNGPSTAGASVDGGTSRRIKAGDVVIIPPNTPHWFANIEGAIEYMVVRFDPGKVVKLK